jgi:cytochrome c553
MTTTRRLGFVATLAGLVLLTGCTRPGDAVAEAGTALAQEKGCIACHGLNGKGTGPTFPNLNGQWESYLREQLQKYRDGDRINVIMNPLVGELTDEEIDILAAYYAAQ